MTVAPRFTTPDAARGHWIAVAVAAIGTIALSGCSGKPKERPPSEASSATPFVSPVSAAEPTGAPAPKDPPALPKARDWYAPTKADFRPEYDRDAVNQSRESWDDYWSWIMQFYDGNLFATGWTKQSEELLDGVRAEGTRDELRRLERPRPSRRGRVVQGQRRPQARHQCPSHFRRTAPTGKKGRRRLGTFAAIRHRDHCGRGRNQANPALNSAIRRARVGRRLKEPSPSRFAPTRPFLPVAYNDAKRNSPRVAPMTTIFISYGRSDSQAQPRLLYDRLAKDFGRDNVFIDVDSMPLGNDFPTVLDHVLSPSRNAGQDRNPDPLRNERGAGCGGWDNALHARTSDC